MGAAGRAMIGAGVVLVALGLLLEYGNRLPLKLGHLPGDIIIRSKNGSFYFPLVTCLVLSAILSLVMWLVRR